MGCFCKAVASGPDFFKIDKPNPVKLLTGAWVSVHVTYPSIVKVLADPGGDLIAVPEMEKNSTTEVYTSRGSSTDRVLILPVPGIWRIRNTGATTVTGLVLADPNGLAAFLYGGVFVAGGSITTSTPAPGTFTDSAADQVTVDAAEAQFLAAGSYKHLTFKNTSTGGQTITIRGNGTTAVALKGWVLGQAASGDGGAASWNHPDVMPAGPFRAVASANGGKLSYIAGT